MLKALLNEEINLQKNEFFCAFEKSMHGIKFAEKIVRFALNSPIDGPQNLQMIWDEIKIDSFFCNLTAQELCQILKKIEIELNSNLIAKIIFSFILCIYSPLAQFFHVH